MIEYKFPDRNNNNKNGKVSLIVVTSPIQSHPENNIIKESLESVIDYPYEKIIISYDKPPKNKLPNKNYEKYIEKMRKEYPSKNGFIHLIMKEHGHFFGTFHNALNLCNSEYVFLVQHDIKLSNKFPIRKCLEYKFPWNIIATHHMKDGLKSTHWFPIIQNKNKELSKVFGWSERIFLTRRDWMMDQIKGCQSGIVNSPNNNYKPSQSLLKITRKNDKNIIRTNNFMDTIFHQEFNRLYMKTQNIKKYSDIGLGEGNIPEKKYMKIYNNYWNEWKCYLLKSKICYHVHLFGRTFKKKNKKSLKRKNKRTKKK